MRRTFILRVVGCAIASAATLAFDLAAAAPLGLSGALRPAVEHFSPVVPVRIICQTYTGAGDMCQYRCTHISSDRTLAHIYRGCKPYGDYWPDCRSQTSQPRRTNCCPLQRLASIQSCTVLVPATDWSEACIYRVCGPADEPSRERARTIRNLDSDRTAVPAPRVGPPQPGLLEGGGGFSRQGPSPAGAPPPSGAPTQLQRGGGGGSGLR
jgi:hypothetical protein